MMKTRKENFDDFRQYCLGNAEIGLLQGGSGGGTGNNGGDPNETEEPPPMWYDPDDTSASRMASPTN